MLNYKIRKLFGFYGNCINNQLVPVALSSAQMDAVFAAVKANPAVNITVDLPAQTVSFDETSFSFEIAEHHKNNLIKGLDAIGQTLELTNAIEAFEKNQPAWL